MPVRTEARTILAGAIAGMIALTAPALAQTAETKTDSAPHFALFTGPASLHGFGLGGSGDFHWGRIPVPLRLSVAFSNENDKSYDYGYFNGASYVHTASDFSSGERKAMASLELVMRPISKKLGIQPYFLGGVGVGTRAGVFMSYSGINEDGTTSYGGGRSPRETSAFFSLGMGLDIGRLFIEAKGASPIANNAQSSYNLVNVGFRFWD